MKTKPKKKKQIRAQLFWLDINTSTPGSICAERRKCDADYHGYYGEIPSKRIAVIDASDEQLLIDNVARVLLDRCPEGVRHMDCVRIKCMEDARAILESMGIVKKRRAK